MLLCKECGYKAKNSNSLKHHMLSHTNPWIGLECTICGRMCKNQFGLDRHMQNKHDKNMNALIGSYTKERFEDDKFKVKHSEATSAAMHRPEVHDKMVANLTIAVNKAYKRPEYHEHVSEASKRMWSKRTDAEKVEVIEKVLGGRLKSIHCISKSGNAMILDSRLEEYFVNITNDDDYLKEVDRVHECIHYDFNGMKKWYIPDFQLITIDNHHILIEIKSSYTVNDERVPYKINASIDFANLRGWFYFVLTEYELQIYSQMIRKAIEC